MAKTKRPLDEVLAEEFTSEFDTRTLAAKVSQRDAAVMARTIAEEFQLRATTLDEEADCNESED